MSDWRETAKEFGCRPEAINSDDTRVWVFGRPMIQALCEEILRLRHKQERYDELVTRQTEEILHLREESKIWEKQSLVQLVKENERLRSDYQGAMDCCEMLIKEREYSEKLREHFQQIRDCMMRGHKLADDNVTAYELGRAGGIADRALAIPRPGEAK